MPRTAPFGKSRAMRDKVRMIYRPHTTNDFDAIAELRWLLKTIKEEGAPTIDPALHDPFVCAYGQQLRSAEAAHDTVHWVAEGAGRLAGALTIRLVRKELSPGKEAGAWGYLTNVFIREEYRNQGCGAALLEQAIAWARAKDLELLIVWPSERSYPFYRRAGFIGSGDPLTLDLE